MKLENSHFSIQIDEASGAISSLVVKGLQSDLIGEPRLAANFRLCLPLEDYQCNYIEGMEHKPKSVTQSGDSVTARFTGMTSSKGKYLIDLEYTVALAGDEIRFRAKLTNHDSHPISEFWFPRLGGWTRFGEGRDAKLALPGYIRCSHDHAIFKEFQHTSWLGTEAMEWWSDYPGMTMPWIDLHHAGTDTGLYLGYHDPIFRFSTWQIYLHPWSSGRPDAWVKPSEAAGQPIGLTFSHVRYPYIHSGETFDTGEFILRVHKGDWHHGSKFYRQWFLKHFPFDKSKSWLREKSAWFTSIIYQPEDRIVADYKTYDQWCRDAEKHGVNAFELIGWDKGGLERDYPDYSPEPKLGGREGYRKLMKSIDARGSKCLTFVNYNIVDQNTEWYKRELKPYTHHDLFGVTGNWATWGESTFLARKGYARRHLISSVVPPLEKILEDKLLALVRDGAHAFQIDKVCAGSLLDFNPLNTSKPDVALCEGLVQAIGRLFAKCQAINPDFRLASEASQDRLIPYADVYYRASWGNDISALRYVFPEWTSCQHISNPYDFRGVNGAVLTGSVICVEPFAYQGSLGHPLYKKLAEYIQEVERIRHELADVIFLGAYHDTLDATITTSPASDTTKPNKLVFRVHGHRETNRRAIVIANQTDDEIEYRWKFLHKDVRLAILHEPFSGEREVRQDQPLRIKGDGLQILVESE